MKEAACIYREMWSGISRPEAVPKYICTLERPCACEAGKIPQWTAVARAHGYVMKPTSDSTLPGNRKFLTAENRLGRDENCQEYCSWRPTVRNKPTGANCQERTLFPDGWPTGILSWRRFPTVSLRMEMLTNSWRFRKPANEAKKNNIQKQTCICNYNLSAPSNPACLIIYMLHTDHIVINKLLEQNK